LFGVSVTPLFCQGLFTQTAITLAKTDATCIGGSDKGLSHLVIQSGIGRKGNRFLLNRCINIDVPDIAALQMTRAFSGLKQLFEQSVNTCLTDAFTPTGQTTGVNRKMVLKVLITTKVLPIGIFNKAHDNAFIT